MLYGIEYRGMSETNKIIVILVALLLCILNTTCNSAPREATQLDGFQVILSEPEIEFPDSITFNIEAESDAEISKIILRYRVDRLNLFPVTNVAFPEFEPGNSVKTGWTWDMKKSGGLPPGAGLEYWWSIEDVQGNSVETSPAELSFDDGHHSWKGLTREQITLLWYHGDDSFARSLINAALQALDRLVEDTGAELEGKVKIYIYADSQDLREALIYPQEWTGGVAFTGFGTIAIGISPRNLDWEKEGIAHELAHLAVHQMTFKGYGVDLPAWLDEGLAMYAQGELAPGFQSILDKAISDDELFSAKSLCSSFPTQDDAARLAYAQSYSLVEYLLEEQGGQKKMLELLSAFQQGSGYVEALDKAYDLDVEQLDTLWRQYIGGD